MDTTHTTHLALAQTWCRYQGQRGTEKQAIAVMRQLTAADLVRMLSERGVTMEAR